MVHWQLGHWEQENENFVYHIAAIFLGLNVLTGYFTSATDK